MRGSTGLDARLVGDRRPGQQRGSRPWPRRCPRGRDRRLGGDDRHQRQGSALGDPRGARWNGGAGTGHVINIGSIAGHESLPGGNVYCASKHAVTAIGRASTSTFWEPGVRVSSVDPGLVETEFSLVRFHGDQDQRADAVYYGLEPLSGRRCRRRGAVLRHPAAARQRPRDDPDAVGAGRGGARPPQSLSRLRFRPESACSRRSVEDEIYSFLSR
jgi:NAD(P)-dependent dehydrogenase (short-subunit alcohol dehydrogenase family)